MGVLQLRRLTTTDRLLITPANGEPIFDLTLKIVFVGDGITVGGINPAGLNDVDATLTGTPRVFTFYDGATPYYVKAYPTKT